MLGTLAPPGAMAQRMIYAFDGCELDIDGYELPRDGAAVPLEPQVLDVLIHLVTHRDRLVVTKVELLDEIWRDRFVANRHWPAASATCGAPLATMAGASAWSGPSTAAVSGSSPTCGFVEHTRACEATVRAPP